MSEELPDNALSEPDQEAEPEPVSEPWEEDQLENEEPADSDELSEDAEADEPAVDTPGEQPEVSQASKPQPAFWPRIPGGVGRQNASGANPVKTDKPGNGNMELTYDALDEEGVEGDDGDLDENFP